MASGTNCKEGILLTSNPEMFYAYRLAAVLTLTSILFRPITKFSGTFFANFFIYLFLISHTSEAFRRPILCVCENETDFSRGILCPQIGSLLVAQFCFLWQRCKAAGTRMAVEWRCAARSS